MNSILLLLFKLGTFSPEGTYVIIEGLNVNDPTLHGSPAYALLEGLYNTYVVRHGSYANPLIDGTTDSHAYLRGF